MSAQWRGPDRSGAARDAGRGALPGASRLVARDAEYQLLAALKDNRRKRSELGKVFVEGIEAIKQALAAPAFPPADLLLRAGAPLSDWARTLAGSGRFERVLSVAEELYLELSDKAEPAELMATFRLPKRGLADLALPAAPFVVLFDRPSDLGNLGSVIRSANAFGADALLTHGHCVDLWEPKVIRASLGAVFRTPCLHVEPYAELEAWLLAQKREKGLRVVGSDSGGEEALGGDAGPLRRPLALVLGNEARGMSVKLKELADAIVAIPMVGQVDSLNVACAATVLMREVARG